MFFKLGSFCIFYVCRLTFIVKMGNLLLGEALSRYSLVIHGTEVFKDSKLVGPFGPPILCIIPDFGHFFKEKRRFTTKLTKATKFYPGHKLVWIDF